MQATTSPRQGGHAGASRVLRLTRRLRQIRGLAAVGIAALSLALAGVSVAEGPVVNVNTATFEELQALPGVGASRATAILEAREARGGFRSADDLLEVKGIGAASLERMRPHVRTSGPNRLAGSDEP